MNSRGRILVIDDDPLFRSLIVSVLRKDYMVAVANEGSEGYYKALEHPPDIAVVDIQMPGWDGLQTLKAFREHPSLINTKVVMLTGDATRETVLAAINGGATDYVIKTSFSREEFLQKIELLTMQIRGVALATSRPQPAQGDETSIPQVDASPRAAEKSAPSTEFTVDDTSARADSESESVATATAPAAGDQLLQDMIDDWE